MASIFGNTFGVSSYFDPLVAVRELLIQSGFIWIAWIILASFVLLFVKGMKDAMTEFNPYKTMFSFIWLILAGVTSYITTGNAMAVILPIGAGIAIVHFANKRMAAEEEKGGAESAQVKAKARGERAAADEEREEETGERETEQEEQIIATEIREEFAKAQLMKQIHDRIATLKTAGYPALDTQYREPVANVLMGLLTQLLNLMKNEETQASEIFGIEKQKTKLQKLQAGREKTEEKLDELISKLEIPVGKEEKRELAAEGTQTRQLMQQVINIEQNTEAFARAQILEKEAREKEEKFDVQLQKQSEERANGFKQLVAKSLKETGTFMGLIEKKSPPEQVAAEYKKVDSYFIESEKLAVAHQEALKNALVAEGKSVAGMMKDLQMGGQLLQDLAKRTALLEEIAQIQHNIQKEQAEAAKLVQERQEAEAAKVLAEKAKQDAAKLQEDVQKAAQEEQQESATAAWFEREIPV